MALLGNLNPSAEPWAGLGYLHFPGSEEAAKGCTHWLVADFGTKVRDTRSVVTAPAWRTTAAAQDRGKGKLVTPQAMTVGALGRASKSLLLPVLSKRRR